MLPPSYRTSISNYTDGTITIISITGGTITIVNEPDETATNEVIIQHDAPQEPKEDDWIKPNYWLTWPSSDDGHLKKLVPGGARRIIDRRPPKEMNIKANRIRAPDP